MVWNTRPHLQQTVHSIGKIKQGWGFRVKSLGSRVGDDDDDDDDADDDADGDDDDDDDLCCKYSGQASTWSSKYRTAWPWLFGVGMRSGAKLNSARRPRYFIMNHEPVDRRDAEQGVGQYRIIAGASRTSKGSAASLKRALQAIEGPRYPTVKLRPWIDNFLNSGIRMTFPQMVSSNQLKLNPKRLKARFQPTGRSIIRRVHTSPIINCYYCYHHHHDHRHHHHHQHHHHYHHHHSVREPHRSPVSTASIFLNIFNSNSNNY